MKKTKSKIVIGVTGAMGSGKTTVARMFAKKGAEALDADRIAHECLLKTGPAYKKIVALFGQEVLLRSGEIDKKKLALAVFKDKKALRRLTGIVHPAVIAQIKERVKKSRKKAVVIDAPLLIEAGLTEAVDALVVVKAKPGTCLRRSVKRLGITKKEARRRMKAQMPLKEKIRYADYVINNDGDLNKIRKQTGKIWKGISGGN